MSAVALAFFAFAALFVIGGIITVGARNAIRSAMGLLVTIIGIAGMYLMLAAEFLAAVQILVYAGAVVVLFIFVIMLLGSAAHSSPDARSAVSRYLGAGVFLTTAGALLVALWRASSGAMTQMPKAPPGLGTIEGIGREMFTKELTPFELSGALLLVAVVGAVAVARGKQVDPTLVAEPPKDAEPLPAGSSARAASTAPGKEHAS